MIADERAHPQGRGPGRGPGSPSADSTSAEWIWDVRDPSQARRGAQWGLSWGTVTLKKEKGKTSGPFGRWTSLVSPRPACSPQARPVGKSNCVAASHCRGFP